MAEGTTLWLLAALSFVPPLAFLVWVRAQERHRREPFRLLLALFGYGATAGVALALLLNLLFGIGLDSIGAGSVVAPSFLAVVVGAPVLEELSKGIGLGLGRRHLDEREDGIIHGAAIGLGFAASENLIYSLVALAEGGVDAAMATLVARLLSSTLLHAGSTALLGFGYGLMVRRSGFVAELMPTYLLAVGFHALYNFLVLTHGLPGFLAAVVLVMAVALYLRKRIRSLDALPHAS